MIVRILQTATCPPALSPECEYTVVGIEAGWYRLVNDDGEPCLYDPGLFSIRDPTEPAFWVTSYGDQNERYSYPAEWSAPGFFEDWHDRRTDARTIFDSVLMARFGITRPDQQPEEPNG